MELLDDFITLRSYHGHKTTFEKVKQEYFNLKEEISDLKQARERMLQQEKGSTMELTLQEKIYLIDLLEIEKNRRGADLFRIETIIDKLYTTNFDLKGYKDLTNSIDKKEKALRKILFEQIRFKKTRDEKGSCSHQFILDDNNLKCVCCNLETKKYNLQEQDLELLKEIATAQHLILKDVTKGDLPLLTILKEEQEKYKSATDFDDEQELFALNLQIKRAHMLDNGILEDGKTRVDNPKYLDEEKTTELLAKLSLEYQEIASSDTRFKDLLKEELLTAKYEILILSGKKIPELVSTASDDLALTSLSKAVYNMSREDRRVNSGYFKSENDAVFYNCLTANPKVNKKIIEMKGINPLT